MTDDTAQSRSLLDGERVYHVPTRPPRDTVGVLRDTRVAQRAFAEHRIDRVVSSGAQIALSALIPALLHRVPFSYVESATRVTDLSATGKLVDHIPIGAPLRAVPVPRLRPVAVRALGVRRLPGRAAEDERPITRAVVTVGGNGDFGFRRLVESARARAARRRAACCGRRGRRMPRASASTRCPSVSSATLSAELTAADVVIGHAGTGTALAALSAGKVPVLAAALGRPRRAHRLAPGRPRGLPRRARARGRAPGRRHHVRRPPRGLAVARLAS